MSNVQCFKIKRGTEYDKAVKEYFTLLPKWENVFSKVSDLLRENITKLALTTENLYVDIEELTKEENKKLFKKNGELKSNLKQSKSILKEYQKIIQDEGLSDFKELRLINFLYGVMRTSGHQQLKSFVTSENDIYYKADFDLEKKTKGLVVPISEIEYEEKYLEELKKREIIQLSV